MQADEIAKKLDLMPSKLWRCVAIAKNVQELRGTYDLWNMAHQTDLLTRGTGRTTEVIVRALVEVSRGQPVWLSAHHEHQELDMVRRAQAWAVRLGFDPKLVLSWRRFKFDESQSMRSVDLRGVFVDHYQP